MSNKGSDQSIWVTKGYEDVVAHRYREIKDIIQKNTSMSFKEAIEIVAGVKVGTWYNYISKGSQRGKVSKYTATKLSEFSDVPYEVFTGKLSFDNNYKEQFATKVKENLGGLKNPNYNDFELLIELSDKIDLIKDEEYLKKLDLIVCNLQEKIELKKKTIDLHKIILKS